MGYLVVGLAYLLGAVPFGYLLTRLAGRGDIRRSGSGNIGATNVMRLLGWRLALPVLLLDAAKGAAAVLLARALAPDPVALQLAAGFAAMAGHSFPVFLGFKGGKGVATALGVLIPLGVSVALAAVLLFAAVVAATRYVSLGSITGALVLPLLFWLLPGYSLPHVYFGAAAALLVILRHHANIGRLLRGREARFGRKAGRPGEEAS
jgi:acyl phosphate:glycerol-3-phosphate acyltransferase